MKLRQKLTQKWSALHDKLILKLYTVRWTQEKRWIYFKETQLRKRAGTPRLKP